MRLIRRRFHGRTLDRATRLIQRYGVLTLVIPAILPPPAPFKLFVLLAGVSGVRPVPFALSIAAGRGVRYFGIGLLSVWYGRQAVTFLADARHVGCHRRRRADGGGESAAGWLCRHYRRREPALTSAS